MLNSKSQNGGYIQIHTVGIYQIITAHCRYMTYRTYRLHEAFIDYQFANCLRLLSRKLGTGQSDLLCIDWTESQLCCIDWAESELCCIDWIESELCCMDWTESKLCCMDD